MFISTGNNFGGPEITFKDYQNEHEIVLNAIFDYDSTDEKYRNATELEVYVPDLSLNKSAVAGCYFAGYGPDGPVGTVVRTWIKNKNTIVIEKLTAWDECQIHRIYICTLYGLRGFRGIDFELHKFHSLSLKQSESIANGYGSDNVYFITPNWMFMCFSIGELSWKATEKTCFLSSLRGIPEDIDMILPFVNGLHDYKLPGMNIHPVHMKDGQIMITDMSKGMGSGTGWESMFYAFIVRDPDTTPEPEGKLSWSTPSIVTSKTERGGDVAIEMAGSPMMMSAQMVSSYYGVSGYPYHIPELPEDLLWHEAFFISYNTPGKGISLQLTRLSFTFEYNQRRFNCKTEAGASAITYQLFDTSAAMPINQ